VQQRGSQPDIGLIPVHIATHAPERWAEIEAAKADAGGNANVWLSKQVQTAILTQRLDWGQLGIDPRWLETETSDCAAAIDASIYANHGADELDRFLAGAAGRGDVAVLVMTMGDVNDDMPRSVLAQYDASVNLRSHTTSIAGRRLPQGAATRLADDVDGPDRDLGVRLRQRVAEHPWWSLHLTGRTYIGNLGEEHNEPEGRLVPVLLGPLDEPVVAYWEAPDRSQRWYLVPDGVDWQIVLDWLVRQLLPELAPRALRQVRSPFLADPELMTPAERKAHQALEQLDSDYQARRQQLQDELGVAAAAATPLRDGLLYGAGDLLKKAVADVLEAAGCQVVDLDETLGGTRSADLLVTAGGRSRLVEVKSSVGRPGEHYVADVRRHLDTWPELGQSTPVEGGTLVVNHDHKLPPADRPRDVYTRPEFVATLSVEVVSSRTLYELWGEQDWAGIRDLVFGSAATAPAADPAAAPPTSRRRRRSMRRRGTPPEGT
jgi:hypothetical protein